MSYIFFCTNFIANRIFRGKTLFEKKNVKKLIIISFQNTEFQLFYIGRYIIKFFYIMSKNEESTFPLISYQQHHRKSFPHIHSYYLQSRLDSTWELWKKKIPVQRFLI